MHVVAGLEYLHSHQIMHRDIKGGNILVDKAGVCKLGASWSFAVATCDRCVLFASNSLLLSRSLLVHVSAARQLLHLAEPVILI